MYQIILFDLDDTLIDFSAAEQIGIRKIHAQFYPTINYSLFEYHFKKLNNELWSRVGAQENGLMPSEVRFLRFKQLNETIECMFSSQEIADAYEHYLLEHIEWIPEVKKTIEFLHQKGHILGIITNGFTESQLRKKEKFALENWFDCFVISDDVGFAKPHKEIFHVALQKLSTTHNQSIHSYNKNSILMVGDSLISDGHGAKNFGINYCHVHQSPPSTMSLEATLTYHINSVAHLPNCIGYETEYKLFLNSL
ncbi:HAD family hydrolase [Legionella saoudiensis]|uniref:HAD family hydrolase n=1 Tax=Legionella saoudiensis TaxID=1750561 RepID=UPI000730083E|nr:HAD family hydrolase [Legionella saoudiensis]